MDEIIDDTKILTIGRPVETQNEESEQSTMRISEAGVRDKMERSTKEQTVTGQTGNESQNEFDRKSEIYPIGFRLEENKGESEISSVYLRMDNQNGENDHETSTKDISLERRNNENDISTCEKLILIQVQCRH